jgi:predicted HTH transcriptional regulator
MSDVPFLDPPSMHSVDRLPVRATTPELIDLEKVAAHIDQARRRNRYRGPDDPHAYLLAKGGLVAVGADLYATLAGVLCFGRDPQQIFPRSVVDIGHYRGVEPISNEVINLEKAIGGTIFDQLARVESYLWANTYHGMTLHPTSFQRVEVNQYPQAVIRELCVNMLAHRDYANYLSASQVLMLRNRIRWVSPGGLTPGITIDNLLDAQVSRNPTILSILYEAGFVEELGQGLNTVVSVLDQEGMAPPQFEDTGVSFMVTVFGRTLETVQGAGGISMQLNDIQRMILTYLQSKGEATPRELRDLFADRAERSLQRDIRGLIESHLIEAIGGSRALRYRLSEVRE